jgi:hypothetical protein
MIKSLQSQLYDEREEYSSHSGKPISHKQEEGRLRDNLAQVHKVGRNIIKLSMIYKTL